MRKKEFHVGQTWVSLTHPHESFQIVGGTIDTCSDAYEEDMYGRPFEDHPESTKIFFWNRSDLNAFNDFLDSKFGDRPNTYPYAWTGECKRGSLLNKIRAYHMTLVTT
ncbi:hypothetical protein C0431_12555 [bacterium]|nr:hypothetical protein [bacterium]